MRTRAAIVWSPGFVRDAVCLLLSQRAPGVEFVAHGESGEELPELVRTHEPEMLLVEVEALGQNPSLVVRELSAPESDRRVVAVSTSGKSGFGFPTLVLGGSSYLTVAATAQQLVDAVIGEEREKNEPIVHALSPRESEVIGLLARARSNKEIAKELNIAEGTVKRHIGNIFQKLGARSRLDAVQLAQAL
jgi:two-component system nitrate/nitrite response regulator NarL